MSSRKTAQVVPPDETELPSIESSSAEPEAGKSPTVQSVEVAVQVLDGIADNNGLVRVNELARQLGMTKARVSRHMQTLLNLGLVARSPHEGYTFGWKLLQLGRAALQDSTLVDVAKPHMVRLRDEVNQTVILSVPAANGSVVLACVESLDITPVTVRIASMLVPPASPAGRLSLAYQPGLGRPAKSPLKHWPGFGAEYELDTGRGFGGVAAPVLDDRNNMIAAISIVAPSTALRPKPAASLVAALARCTAGIKAEYVGTSP